MSLMLHAGGKLVDREVISQVPTPEAVDRWQPVPHLEFLEQVEESLAQFGVKTTGTELALSKDGDRFFGLMTLEPQELELKSGYTTALGIRNSHDKSFAAELTLGSNVFVCDNLAFSGEIRVIRKHTRFIQRDLPRLTAKAVGKMTELRIDQSRRITAYSSSELSETQVHDLVIKMLYLKIIGETKVLDVLNEYNKPHYQEFEQHTAWSFFNAVTYSMKEVRVSELNARTQRLHGLMDSYLGLLPA